MGRMTVEQATLRLAGRSETRINTERMGPLLGEQAVTLGYGYRSGTVLAESEGDVIAVDPRLRRAEPGTRCVVPRVHTDGCGGDNGDDA